MIMGFEKLGWSHVGVMVGFLQRVMKLESRDGANVEKVYDKATVGLNEEDGDVLECECAD